MNNNCLDGIKCPDCSSEGPFDIAALCVARVNDDGVEDTRDFEWDNSSVCVCVICSKAAPLSDFKIG
jgi:hypothetical protein